MIRPVEIKCPVCGSVDVIPTIIHRPVVHHRPAYRCHNCNQMFRAAVHVQYYYRRKVPPEIRLYNRQVKQFVQSICPTTEEYTTKTGRLRKRPDCYVCSHCSHPDMSCNHPEHPKEPAS